MEKGSTPPLTSSCGRLFDAISSLLGIRQRISYEGQAAMELEALAAKQATGNWKEELTVDLLKTHSDIIEQEDGIYRISSPEFVTMILNGIRSNASVGQLALQFHALLICAITRLVEILAEETGVRQVVLSGGCMQNSLLLEGFFHSLQKLDLEIFTGTTVPINDGGISIGQTVIGGLRHVSRNPDESDRRSG